MNTKKIRRIMNKYGLIAEYAKKSTPNKRNKQSEENVKPDLLKRDFQQDGWVTDITYLIFANKRAYLSTIMDLKTRNVISYKIGKRNDNELVIETLNDAIQKKNPNGVILHSDQGFQYTSNEYRIICEANGIQISMSRKGTPLDNAVIESFHSLLKKETLYNNDIKNIDEYVNLVHQWIDFYNNKRLRHRKK